MQASDTPIETAPKPASHAVHAALRFARVLWRRKIYVVCALAVTCTLGALYYFTATRMYEAQAQVLVLQTGADVWETSMTPEGHGGSLIPTYEKLFTSAVVLERALKNLRRMPVTARVDLAGVEKEKQASALTKNLSARAVRRTNVIELGYRSKSPQAAEAVVSTVLQSYKDFIDENHRTVSAQIVDILKRERDEVYQALNQKELQLVEARQQVGDLHLNDNPHEVHPIVQRVLTLNESLLEVQEERLKLESTLAAIRSALQNGGDLRQHLAAIEPVVGRELLRTALGLGTFDQRTATQLESRLIDLQAERNSLLQHLGPKHPDVVQLEQSIHNTQQYLASMQSNIDDRLASMQSRELGPALLSLVQEKLAQAAAYEDQMLAQYQQAESHALEVSGQWMEVALLEREAQRMQQRFDTLMDQIDNIGVREDHADVRIAVISEPKASTAPVSPKKATVGLLCLFLGFAAGTFIVYVIDILDDRFRSPEELQEQLATQVLAVVRPLPEPEGQGIEKILVHQSPESVESEAFRTLRTTLAFSGQDRDRIVVTSAEPSDGKTTVISNLAASYAQANKKTLLIDADLRKPGLTKLFELRGRPGLTDVLRSSDAMHDACTPHVCQSEINNLDILPCGPKAPDPAELLSGHRFEELIAWAETNYDLVLVDTPPILAASDAAIAGRLVDGVIVVVQPQKNHRRLVLRAVEGLRSMHVNLAGVVANRVGSEDDDGYYGYGYGYGYGSGYGYAQDDEEENEVESPIVEDTIDDEPHEENIVLRRRAA